MNPQDPLANLNPLREPGMVGWWPLAPGWWFLIAVALLLICTGAYIIYRRYRANAYRRQALLQLEQLYSDWRNNADAARFLAELNALLKSVALVSYPRETVAARSGPDWVQFLNETASASTSGRLFGDDFALSAYRRGPQDLDFEEISRSAAAWIKRHRCVP